MIFCPPSRSRTISSSFGISSASPCFFWGSGTSAGCVSVDYSLGPRYLLKVSIFCKVDITLWYQCGDFRELWGKSHRWLIYSQVVSILERGTRSVWTDLAVRFLRPDLLPHGIELSNRGSLLSNWLTILNTCAAERDNRSLLCICSQPNQVLNTYLAEYVTHMLQTHVPQTSPCEPKRPPRLILYIPFPFPDDRRIYSFWVLP